MADRPLEFTDFYRCEFGNLVRALRPLAAGAAEDVAHEALVIALHDWERIARLDVPFAWVLKVARRIAWRRSGRETRRGDLEAAAVRGQPECGDPITDLDVTRLLAHLPERDVTAIRLHHLRDESIERVAQRLGCSPSAAKVALHRARERLAAEAAGLSGRWVSERAMSVGDIVRFVSTVGEPRYVDAVVDDDLQGRGGTWELSVHGGTYALHRDDGMELDRGRIEVDRHRFALRPTRGVGVATFTFGISCERLVVGVVGSTEPPTLGVPDLVWANLFYTSGAFTYAGRATHHLGA